MGDDGYMDAAAVPVPDAGDDITSTSTCACGNPAEHGPHEDGPTTVDDTLRERLTAALHDEWPRVECESIVERLLPLIREHVAAAVQGERERADRLVSWKDTGFRERDKWRVRAETAEATSERVRNLVATLREEAPRNAAMGMHIRCGVKRGTAKRIEAALDGTEATT